jgi:hypothetical protein
LSKIRENQGHVHLQPLPTLGLFEYNLFILQNRLNRPKIEKSYSETLNENSNVSFTVDQMESDKERCDEVNHDNNNTNDTKQSDDSDDFVTGFLIFFYDTNI